MKSGKEVVPLLLYPIKTLVFQPGGGIALPTVSPPVKGVQGEEFNLTILVSEEEHAGPSAVPVRIYLDIMTFM